MRCVCSEGDEDEGTKRRTVVVCVGTMIIEDLMRLLMFLYF